MWGGSDADGYGDRLHPHHWSPPGDCGLEIFDEIFGVGGRRKSAFDWEG